VHREPDRTVHVQEVHLHEQILPIVPFDFRAGPASEEHELQGACVGDVRRHVRQVLAGPPRADRRRVPVSLPQERAGQDERQRELKETSS
jgi:hypothetical protein